MSLYKFKLNAKYEAHKIVDYCTERGQAAVWYGQDGTVQIIAQKNKTYDRAINQLNKIPRLVGVYDERIQIPHLIEDLEYCRDMMDSYSKI